MQKYFNIKDGEIVKSDTTIAVIQVFIAPNEQEKKQIIQRLGVDNYDFDAALDPDEISRVEFLQNRTSIIWKQPYIGSYSLEAKFDVLSVGLFIHKDTLYLIMGGDYIPFNDNHYNNISSINDVLLRYFFYTTRQYMNHLKAIKQAKTKLQSKLNVSMENKYFLQMFDISESLVYYIDAIEANGAVLSKLLTNSEKLNFSPQQKAFLNDAIQENTQGSRQARIYSKVLSDLMDARGNIINNNMNVLLKNLTLINVVFLPLNLLAGMGGMSEFSMMIGDYQINWRIGYFLFTLIMIIIGLLTWVVLKKYIGHQTNGHKLEK